MLVKVWIAENSKDDKTRGRLIFCKIGKYTQQSYWTSPPKKLVAHYQYLMGRYDFINTKQRGQKFVELYNMMFWEITDYQKEMMRHAIGLDHSKKPYRNRYFTNELDTDWNYLVEIGAAFKSVRVQDDGMVRFWLTKQGVEFLIGKTIQSKTYEEL